MRRLRLPIGLVLLVASAVPAAIGSARAAEPPEPANQLGPALAAIDTFVAQRMKHHRTPGVALALTSHAELLHVATYGFADIKTRRPVTAETLFQIGSISKGFTAVALLQLADDGKLDLQAPLSDSLPWFEVQSDYGGLSAHDLLTHSAGIPSNRDDLPPSPFMAWALRQRSAAWRPGEKFLYSNVGYQVLHRLVERLGSMPYPELIRTRILEPLGMEQSVARISSAIRPRQAVGYAHLFDDRPAHPSHPLVEAPFVEYDIGDGSIASTPADLAAWVRLLLQQGEGPGGRILSEASFDRFSTLWMRYEGDASADDGGDDPPGDESADGSAIEDGSEDRESGYGYGIGVETVSGRHRLRHSGGMIGFSAQIIADLTSGLGVVVFVNGPGDPTEVAEFALEALRTSLAGAPLPEIPEPVDPLHLENAADYAGKFSLVASTEEIRGRVEARRPADGATDDEGPMAGGVLELIARGERLMLRADGEEIALESRGEDRFVTPHPGFDLFVFAFGRDEDGRVTQVSHGPDWYVHEAYRGPREFSTPGEWQAFVGHYRSYSPWFSNFRVILRQGRLLAVTAEGVESAEGELELTTIGERLFRIGEAPTPETLEFGAVVEGKALQASWSGHLFYRFGPLVD